MSLRSNYNVLPFYPEERFVYQQLPSSFGEFYPLIANKFNLLPFQIYIPRLYSGVPPTPESVDVRIVIIEQSTNTVTDVTTLMESKGFTVDHNATPTHAKFTFPANQHLAPLNVPEGRYQMHLAYGDVQNVNGLSVTRYSEHFHLVHKTDDCLKLIWWNQGAIGYGPDGFEIDYTTPFRNFLYLNTHLGKPRYPFTEQAKDRDGFKFIEKQISEKTFGFEFMAPEYLCDVIRLIRLHDFVRVIYEGQVYEVDDILPTIEWLEQGNLAAVTVEFQIDTVVKKLAKSEAPSGATFSGDFSNDYN